MDSENHTLVSVAIPVYKAKFLRDAIESVLNQTYNNIELIIVNDKSPEDISSVVSSFTDNRIRYYVNEENMGAKDPSYNWDKCLSYAQGEFFCLLCDDDLYKPTFIEELLKLANNYPDCNVFRARCERINDAGNVTGYYASSPQWESCCDYMYHVLSGWRTQTISEFLYRTVSIKKYGFVHLPMAWHADYLSVYLLCKVGGIASTTNILVTIRTSGLNISSQTGLYGLEKAEAFMKAYLWIKDYIQDTDETLRPLLMKELDVWKYRMDKSLICSLKFSEKVKILFCINKFGIRKNSFYQWMIRGPLMKFIKRNRPLLR